jgi:co-chaperonin GroES (HSP10)
MANNILKNIMMVGDRVLIKPKTLSNRTTSGLYLPPTVIEKEQVLSGYVIKAGPGYPIPSLQDESEIWKKSTEEARYLPLQVKEGDLALYLQKSGWEIELNDEKYIIIPQSAILMVIRDHELFD